MELDQYDIRSGLRFLCGTWQVDYIVNAFSNDLAHIPAAEWKSDDGKDFSCMTYTFLEDHTMFMRDTASGREERGTWEQTDLTEYHYTLNGFLDLPDGAFKSNAETLHIQDGCLVFSIGFLAIGMKKIEEGTVTEEPDIGTVEPGAEDSGNTAIVGKYAVAKAMSVVGGKFGLFEKEAVRAELDRKLKSGETDKREYDQTMATFDSVIEFTPDHRVITWMKIPAGVTEEMLQEALAAGQVKDIADGFFSVEERQWKCVDGQFYYDTKEHREVIGEKVSSWDALTADSDGLIPFASGFLMIRRI